MAGADAEGRCGGRRAAVGLLALALTFGCSAAATHDEGASAPGSLAVPPPPAAAAPSAPRAPQTATRIDRISIESAPPTTRVVLQLDGSVEPEVSLLENRRLVIDVPNTTCAALPRVVEGAGDALVERVRTGQHGPPENKSRIVIDLRQRADFSVRAQGDRIVAWLSPSDAATLERSERAALAAMRAVVVTSPRTADTLVSLMSVPVGAITVALPGVDDAPIAPGSRDGVLRLLCVGTVVPRKGQALLVDALSGLPGRWELTIVGSLETDPATADRLRAVIGEAGLGKRVRLVGELSSEALAMRYDASDLFVSASFYEGYCMALAEALARGLPIVAAAGGAVADTVPSAAGLLVSPGDRDALREALTRCVREPALLARLREGALLTRERLPRWQDTAARVEHALLGKAT